MSRIKGKIISNTVPKFGREQANKSNMQIIEVDYDPTTSDFPIGTMAIWTNGTTAKYYFKTGDANTAWEETTPSAVVAEAVSQSGGGGGTDYNFVWAPDGGTKASIVFSGNYDGLVVQSSLIGTQGNSFYVEIIGDSAPAAGVTSEMIGSKFIIHYESGVSTGWDIESAFNNFPSSQYFDIASFITSGATVLNSPGDDVTETQLSGGIDAITDESKHIYSNFNTLMLALTALEPQMPKRLRFDTGTLNSVWLMGGANAPYDIGNTVEFEGIGQDRPGLDILDNKLFLGFPSRIDNLDIEQRSTGSAFNISGGTEYNCVITNTELDGDTDKYIVSVAGPSTNLYVRAYGNSRLDDFQIFFEDAGSSYVEIQLFENSDFEGICVEGNTSNNVNVEYDATSQYDANATWGGTISVSNLDPSINIIDVNNSSFTALYPTRESLPIFYLPPQLGSASFDGQEYTGADNITFFGGGWTALDGARLSNNGYSPIWFKNLGLNTASNTVNFIGVGSTVQTVFLENSTITGGTTAATFISSTVNNPFRTLTLRNSHFSSGLCAETPSVMDIFLYEYSSIAANTLVGALGTSINIYHDGTATISRSHTGMLGTLNIYNLSQSYEIIVDQDKTIDEAVAIGESFAGALYPRYIINTNIPQTLTVAVTKNSSWIGHNPNGSSLIDTTAATITGVQLFENISVNIADHSATFKLSNSTISLPVSVTNLSVYAINNSFISGINTDWSNGIIDIKDSKIELNSVNASSVSLTRATAVCFSWGASSQLSSFIVVDSIITRGNIAELDEPLEGDPGFTLDGVFCHSMMMNVNGLRAKFIGSNWTLFKCSFGDSLANWDAVTLKNIDISVKQNGVGTAKILDFSGRTHQRYVSIESFHIRRRAGGTINWHDITGGAGVVYRSPSSIIWVGQPPGNNVLGMLSINGTSVVGYGTPE